MIPALNRDGDILSDFVLPLFGSIAGSESLVVAFVDDYTPEGDHGRGGTRHRAVAGRKEHREPARDDPRRRRAAHPHGRATRQAAAGRAIREAALEAVAAGIRTADLGGHSSTTEYTEEVISRTRQKLEVWATLGRGLVPCAPTSRASTRASPARCGRWRRRPRQRVRDRDHVPVPHHLPAQRARVLGCDRRASWRRWERDRARRGPRSSGRSSTVSAGAMTLVGALGISASATASIPFVEEPWQAYVAACSWASGSGCSGRAS